MRKVLVLTLLMTSVIAFTPINVSQAQIANTIPDSLGSSEDSVGVNTGSIPADSALAFRLRNAFASLEGYERVQVEVAEGLVILKGTVAEAEEREQAGELAGAFSEALYVINNLTYNLEVEARVAPVVARMQQYVNDTIAYLPILAIAVLIVLFFGLIAKFIDKLLPSFQRMGVSQLAGNLVVRLLRAALWVVGIVMALDILGISALVGAVLGTAGLMGIAIGFAFQDIIENYLAGLLMSVRRPFGPSDHVKIGSEEGKVVRLTSRELILMTLDGNHVRIPNALVFKSTIYNYTRNPRRRFSFEAGVDVEEDLQRVQRIGTDTLRSMKSIMDEPGPTSVVKALGDFNVIVVFFAWVDQTHADYSKARSEAIRFVKNALDEADVLMPEPIYNVKMQSLPKTSFNEAQSQLKGATVRRERMEEGDVSVEKEIDKQISEDLQISDEPNLL